MNHEQQCLNPLLLLLKLKLEFKLKLLLMLLLQLALPPPLRNLPLPPQASIPLMQLALPPSLRNLPLPPQASIPIPTALACSRPDLMKACAKLMLYHSTPTTCGTSFAMQASMEGISGRASSTIWFPSTMILRPRIRVASSRKVP